MKFKLIVLTTAAIISSIIVFAVLSVSASETKDVKYSYNGYIWGVRVGKLEVEQRQIGANSGIVHFSADTSGVGRAFRSMGLNISSYANISTLLPYQTNFFMQVRRDRKQKTIKYNRTSCTFTVEYPDKEKKVEDMPPGTVDLATMLLQLRVKRIDKSKPFSMYYVYEDRLWRIDLEYKKNESVSVPAGTFDCYSLEGKAYRADRADDPDYHRDVKIWRTSGDENLIVKGASGIFIGHVSVELTEYTK